MALAAILTTAVTIGKELVSNQSGSTQPAFVRCEGQPSDEAVAYMLARAPASAIADLKAAASRMGIGPEKFSTPYQIGYESYGGNNCNWWASDLSKALKTKFDVMMATWGPPMIGSGTVSGVTVQASQQSTTPTLGDTIKSIGGNILDAAGNIVKTTVAGAAAGAQASTQGAATGSAAPAAFAGLLPVLLVGGGIALVMLMRRR